MNKNIYDYALDLFFFCIFIGLLPFVFIGAAIEAVHYHGSRLINAAIK